MRISVVAITLFAAALIARSAPTQVPALPAGAETRWIVGQPNEIVAYVVFDPASVAPQLPQQLRFVTVSELATTGVRWASDHLAKHPAHARWGVSFFEIVRAGRFAIDGRSPNWPSHGAAAVWCARVAPAVPTTDLGPGRPFLELEFWMPDRAYAAYMRGKGHHATYGDVTLVENANGTWRGTIDIDGLSAVAECTPIGPVTGGAQSAGTQVFFPPASSGLRTIVRVAFAGHREQECGEDSSVILRGSHPLAKGTVLAPSSFQYGYELSGGAYRRRPAG
jgi:hypothetical protein